VEQSQDLDYLGIPPSLIRMLFVFVFDSSRMFAESEVVFLHFLRKFAKSEVLCEIILEDFRQVKCFSSIILENLLKVKCFYSIIREQFAERVLLHLFFPGD
jgi:hypothetical protein